MKVSRTVWSRGKVGDYIKNLPIAMKQGRERAYTNRKIKKNY